MEAGKCLKCNSEHLTYGACELVSDQLYYPVLCLSCGWCGKEWYDLTYFEHTDETDE